MSSGRTLFSIVLALILGLLANLLIAWLCVWMQRGPTDPALGQPPQDVWNHFVTANPQHGAATLINNNGAIGCDFFILGADAPTLPADDQPRVMVTRAGWPMRAFEAMHSWNNVVPQHTGGMAITPFEGRVAWVSILPHTPIMPGIVVNTVLYTVVCWLLLWFVLRQPDKGQAPSQAAAR